MLLKAVGTRNYSRRVYYLGLTRDFRKIFHNRIKEKKVCLTRFSILCALIMRRRIRYSDICQIMEKWGNSQQWACITAIIPSRKPMIQL
jgi:hypothetical protein